jgi:hypothetical protein
MMRKPILFTVILNLTCSKGYSFNTHLGFTHVNVVFYGNIIELNTSCLKYHGMVVDLSTPIQDLC